MRAPQARVDFAPYGTIDPGEGASRITEQAEARVAAFKFSTFGTHPTRFPRINPPLLAEAFAEVEALWRQVAAGNVTLVSTDHVSWSEDRKTNPDMLANASGVLGLEAMVPLFVKGALERGGAELGDETDGGESGEAFASGRRAHSKRARMPTSPCWSTGRCSMRCC